MLLYNLAAIIRMTAKYFQKLKFGIASRHLEKKHKNV